VKTSAAVCGILLAAAPAVRATDDPPLVAAAAAGDVARVRALLGAGLRVRNREGETALHAAAGRGRTEVLLVLIDAGADITARDQLGRRRSTARRPRPTDGPSRSCSDGTLPSTCGTRKETRPSTAQRRRATSPPRPSSAREAPTFRRATRRGARRSTRPEPRSPDSRAAAIRRIARRWWRSWRPAVLAPHWPRAGPRARRARTPGAS